MALLDAAIARNPETGRYCTVHEDCRRRLVYRRSCADITERADG